MQKIKTRFWLTVLAALGFIAPLFVVAAIEHAKTSAQAAAAQADTFATLSTNEEARTQYYQNIDATKAEYQQLMNDAKAQYEALLKGQGDQVAAHQTTQTQTTTQPVTVQKIVQSNASSSSSQSAPKSSRKTKTS